MDAGLLPHFWLTHFSCDQPSVASRTECISWKTWKCYPHILKPLTMMISTSNKSHEPGCCLYNLFFFTVHEEQFVQLYLNMINKSIVLKWLQWLDNKSCSTGAETYTKSFWHGLKDENSEPTIAAFGSVRSFFLCISWLSWCHVAKLFTWVMVKAKG